MTKNRLLALIKDKNWKAIKDVPLESLIQLLSFQECMFLGYDLFFLNLHNDDFQDFAVRLFFFIRDHFNKEWMTDWKNDVFLGQLCGLTWRYDQSYNCYKQAYERLDDPPDSLLLLLAACNSFPGKPQIDILESELYLKQAIAKKVSYEAALQMRSLARNKKNLEQEIFWDQKCDELKNDNIHIDSLKPDIFFNK